MDKQYNLTDGIKIIFSWFLGVTNNVHVINVFLTQTLQYKSKVLLFFWAETMVLKNIPIIILNFMETSNSNYLQE